jgi:tRNA A37 threonylcarbamoyladenosine synthetase subunit TsaC/SUA5/YrdC
MAEKRGLVGGASTVGVLKGNTVRVLRAGPISADDLRRALEG